VIDVAKDALAVMADALVPLGDAVALYGFSGQGRDGVEFAVAKDFADPLGASTWAALAAIEPRGATRMGAAVRHAASKLARQPAARRLLVVVSDGYPQDSDYGPDRNDEEYGVQDTARALQDAERAGLSTLCVTIDPAGHDYLRRMCPPESYLVIDDVPALPAGLAAAVAARFESA
jgi:nitric oxide reductase NorD protein